MKINTSFVFFMILSMFCKSSFAVDLSGRLYEGITKAPQAGAYIFLLSSNQQEILGFAQTTSGKNGGFWFVGGLPGNSNVVVVGFHPKLKRSIWMREIKLKNSGHQVVSGFNFTEMPNYPDDAAGKGIVGAFTVISRYVGIINAGNTSKKIDELTDYLIQYKNSHKAEGDVVFLRKREFKEKSALTGNYQDFIEFIFKFKSMNKTNYYVFGYKINGNVMLEKKQEKLKNALFVSNQKDIEYSKRISIGTSAEQSNTNQTLSTLRQNNFEIDGITFECVDVFGNVFDLYCLIK